MQAVSVGATIQLEVKLTGEDPCASGYVAQSCLKVA
jgi:hypothetical protein